MTGGIGNDTYVVDHTGDLTTELASEGTDLVQSSITWTLAANVENLTLTGAGAINGTGNTANNSLVGNAAANVLNGGTGNDAMTGGAGNDTYVVDSATDVTTELAGEGTDLVQSSITWTLAANVENLTLTGSAAINGTGNTLDNVITGNSANNLLSGAAGSDTLTDSGGDNVYVGGAGSDGLTVTSTGIDRIAVARGHGSDTVSGSGTAANDVLEVSNGIVKADMGLVKSGNDLVVDFGLGESVTLKNWYAGVRNVGTLKIIGDAGWVPGQPGPPAVLETLSLVTLASQFDAARAADPLLTRWPLSLASTTLVLRTAAFSDEGLTPTLTASQPRWQMATSLTPKAARLRAALELPDAALEARSNVRNLRALLDLWAPATEVASTGADWLMAAAKSATLSAEVPETIDTMLEAAADAAATDTPWTEDLNGEIAICDEHVQAEWTDAMDQSGELAWAPAKAEPASIEAAPIHTAPPHRTAPWWDDARVPQSVAPLIWHAAVITGWQAVGDLINSTRGPATEFAEEHSVFALPSLFASGSLAPSALDLKQHETASTRFSSGQERRIAIQ
jgi:hypothetical protein